MRIFPERHERMFSLRAYFYQVYRVLQVVIIKFILQSPGIDNLLSQDDLTNDVMKTLLL